MHAHARPLALELARGLYMPDPSLGVPQGMHGDGMRGVVGHMCIECVSYGTVVGRSGQEPSCVGGIVSI